MKFRIELSPSPTYRPPCLPTYPPTANVRARSLHPQSLSTTNVADLYAHASTTAESATITRLLPRCFETPPTNSAEATAAAFLARRRSWVWTKGMSAGQSSRKTGLGLILRVQTSCELKGLSPARRDHKVRSHNSPLCCNYTSNFCYLLPTYHKHSGVFPILQLPPSPSRPAPLFERQTKRPPITNAHLSPFPVEGSKNFEVCQQLCFKANRCGMNHKLADSRKVSKKRKKWIRSTCGPCSAYPCPKPSADEWGEL